ncbi:unnamed protein product [Closterium sp. Yama58-4]|nr:unnamed protein product [Closterium sp. Yama58-4]
MARGAGTGAGELDGLRGRGGGEAEGRTRGDAQQGCTEGRERSEGGEGSEGDRGEGMVARGDEGLAGGACEDEASARGGREQRDRGAAAGRPREARDHGQGQGQGQGRRVIVISGPTAVGKSRLALAVAEAVRGGEVVSADSVQVYRRLDVGSAKASPDEQRRVPHHLLDIREPWQGGARWGEVGHGGWGVVRWRGRAVGRRQNGAKFTAADFYEEARAAVEGVVQRGGVPVVVGGTGLYLAWLLHGRPATPPSCPALERAVAGEIEAAVMLARQARRGRGSRGDERSVGAVGGAEEAVGGGEGDGDAAEGRASAADAVRDGLEKALSADGRSEQGNDGAGVGVGVGVGGGGMVVGGMEDEMGGRAEAGRGREARERGWASRQPSVRYAEEGDWEAALAALAAAGDPITAGQLARNDWYRLTRAFEILRATGRPRSEITVPSHEAKHTSPPAAADAAAAAAATASSPPPFDFHCFFLDAPRLPLYRRIDRRCEEMVQVRCTLLAPSPSPAPHESTRLSPTHGAPSPSCIHLLPSSPLHAPSSRALSPCGRRAGGLLEESLALLRVGLHPDSSSPTHAIFPCSLSCSLLPCVCPAGGLLEESLALLRVGLHPDSSSPTHAIFPCSLSCSLLPCVCPAGGLLEESLALLRVGLHPDSSSPTHTIFPCSLSCSLLPCVCPAGGLLEESLALLRVGLHPDSSSPTHAIFPCSLSCSLLPCVCPAGGLLEESLALLRVGLHPDSSSPTHTIFPCSLSCSLLPCVCPAGGLLEESLALLRVGLHPDSSSPTHAIFPCSLSCSLLPCVCPAGGLLEESLALLRVGLHPDSSSPTHAIFPCSLSCSLLPCVCSAGGLLEESLALLRVGLHPDSSSPTHAIFPCSLSCSLLPCVCPAGGLLEESLALLRVGLHPDSSSPTHTIFPCSLSCSLLPCVFPAGGLLEESLALLRVGLHPDSSSPTHTIFPCSLSCSLLPCVCPAGGLLEESLALLRVGLHPDSSSPTHTIFPCSLSCSLLPCVCPAGGLLEESLALLRAGLQPDSSSPTRAIGYRQAMCFLLHCQRLMGQARTSEERGLQEQQVEEQRRALQEALQEELQAALVAFILEFQQASRRYAKRQITWFRSQPLFQWLPAHTPLVRGVGPLVRGVGPLSIPRLHVPPPLPPALHVPPPLPPALHVPPPLPPALHVPPPLPSALHVPPPVPSALHVPPPLPSALHVPPPLPSALHVPPPLPSALHAPPPLPSALHVPPPLPSALHAPPPLPSALHVPPPLPSALHVPPPLPSALHVPPPLPSALHVPPPLPSALHVPPPLPSALHVPPPLPSALHVPPPLPSALHVPPPLPSALHDELVGMVLRDFDGSTGGEGHAGGEVRAGGEGQGDEEEQEGGEGRFGAEREGGQGGVGGGGGGSGHAWEKAGRREQRRESKEEERALKGYRAQLEIYCDQNAIDATLAWIQANVTPRQQGSQSEQGNTGAAVIMSSTSKSKSRVRLSRLLSYAGCIRPRADESELVGEKGFQRHVYCNEPHRHVEKGSPLRYCNNSISTTKYSILSFLPKALFEQFRRVANLYFLLCAILALTPLTPYAPYSLIAPLVLVVGVSMIKEAIEDWRRYLADDEVNKRKVLRHVGEGRFEPCEWKAVRVGDVVKVLKDEFFPADLLMLASSYPDGVCYVETMNLDGETNLKLRKALERTLPLEDPEALAKFTAEIKCEDPNPSLYTFVGNLEWEGEATALTAAQVLLRDSKLRNTAWVVGVVIFTGHDSKVMMNATAAPSKRSSIERRMDKIIYFLFACLLLMAIVGSIVFGLRTKDQMPSWWYLGPNDTDAYYDPAKPAASSVLQCLTAIILYGYLIPISLYVSIEIVKIFQAWFISADRGMYFAETDMPARARTSNLNEELGQVDTVLSDKTGTLTCNQMDFLKCSIAGLAYGRGITEVERATARRLGRDLSELEDYDEEEERAAAEAAVSGTAKPGVKGFALRDNRLLDGAWLRESHREEIRMFLRVLAVCHTVIPEVDEASGQVEYEAESPDEAAFVEAARQMGVAFFKRTQTTVWVREPDETGQSTVDREYTILALIEFNSTRKRMSVVVRDPSNRILLMTKGADSVIYERLAPTGRQHLEATRAHLHRYGEAGLRTLALAYRELSEEECGEWLERYEGARRSLSAEREALVDAAAEEIEQGLTLLGATAVEDKLQQGVPEAIDRLAQAGIKIWVLTGDKLETAINIGFACSLLRDDMKQIVVSLDSPDIRKLEDTGDKEKLAAVCRDRVKRLLHDGAALIDRAREGGAPATGADANGGDAAGNGNGDGGEGDGEGDEEGDEGPARVFALVIDGKSLAFALEPELRAALLALAMQCASVVCCRVSPKQKALVTRLVKDGTGRTTLGIGDGANDVGMIHEADIGVGISGVEGQQAVMASDFAIAQFKYLERLLLVHGHWSYKRIANAVTYFFYKNVAFGLTIFYYNAYAVFSGQIVYNSWACSLYNVFFTSLPVIGYGVLEQDLSDKQLLMVSRGHVGLCGAVWCVGASWEHIYGTPEDKEKNVTPCNHEVAIKLRAEAAAANERDGSATLSTLGSTSTLDVEPTRRARQRDIRDMVDDTARARLDHLWAAAVADNDWAFHTSRSPAVQNFVDAAVAFGKQYTLPSPFRVSGVLLQKLVADTANIVRPLKESWKTTGCTLSVDGWTCMKSRGLVCVMAHNDTAPVIVKTVDSKTAKKTGEYLAGLIQRAICDVGDSNVVQVVMDNASNNRRAADILRDGFPAIFFNNCAAHVLDLMLHDIGKVRAVRRVLNQVHRVVMIVKGSASAVVLFEELFSTLSLVRPGATRFGTQVIMLTRFLEVKKALKEMVISEEWESVAVARSEEGRAVRLLLLDEVFWDCATAVLRLMTPVYEVLRVVDTRALVMGQIYGLMLDATVKTNIAAEAAAKMMLKRTALLPAKDKPAFLAAIKAIIARRWDVQLHNPLHAMGWLLNPRNQYGREVKNDPEVRRGAEAVIQARGGDVAQRTLLLAQLTRFHLGEGLIGSDDARWAAQVLVASGRLTEAEWWLMYGGELQALMGMAVTVLSQPVTSSEDLSDKQLLMVSVGCVGSYALYPCPLPGIGYRVQEQDLSDKQLLMPCCLSHSHPHVPPLPPYAPSPLCPCQFPALYQQGPKNVFFHWTTIAMWIFYGFAQSVLLFWSCLAAVLPQASLPSGKLPEMNGLSATLMTGVVVAVNFQIALITEHWTWITHLFIWGSIAVWYLFLGVYSYFGPDWSTDYYYIFSEVLAPSALYWLTGLLLLPVMAVLPYFVFRGVESRIAPPDQQIVQEIVRLKQDEEAAKAAVAPPLAPVGFTAAVEAVSKRLRKVERKRRRRGEK